MWEQQWKQRVLDGKTLGCVWGETNTPQPIQSTTEHTVGSTDGVPIPTDPTPLPPSIQGNAVGQEVENWENFHHKYEVVPKYQVLTEQEHVCHCRAPLQCLKQYLAQTACINPSSNEWMNIEQDELKPFVWLFRADGHYQIGHFWVF